MSTATDQIEKLAKEIVILKVAEDLRSCKTLEELKEIQQKYDDLAQKIEL